MIRVGRWMLMTVIGTVLLACNGSGSSERATASAQDGSVSIAPEMALVQTAQSAQFDATVSGSVRTGVTWSIQESGGGTVTSAGLYTAPASAGTYHVVVTSQADTTKTAAATVTVTAASNGSYITPSSVTGDVVVAVDSHTTRSISPYIYGVNNAEFGGAHAADFTIWSSQMPALTMSRVGGNRSTGLNWESGYSNCGLDCGTGAGGWTNDTNMLDNVFASPGVGAAWSPRITQQLNAGQAIVVTAPILGYVAKDASGHQPIPVAPNQTTPGTPSSTHWNQVLSHDPAGATATPNTSDAYAYTDDFVKWIDTNWPGKLGSGQIQLELDNEPDIWRGTHAEIIGTTNGSDNLGSNQVNLPFSWYANRTIDHARYVKAAAPGATVWAGAFAGWDGLVQFNYEAHPNGPPSGYNTYFDYLLDQWKTAETTYGRRLVDVFDMHWYVQDLGGGSISVTNDDATQSSTVVAAREQSTRSLWDPYYIEGSWVSSSIPSALQQHCDSNGLCPIALLPTMQASIDAHYPGTKIAIGEYWYGRGGDISSTISNADFLGIMARQGVYSATMWWNASNIWAYNTPNGCNDDGGCVTNHAYQCALKAIDVYRNYDGAGATFGDAYVQTVTSDPTFTNPGAQDERLTAYAGTMAADPSQMVIVAINKAIATSLNTGFRVTHTRQFTKASVYRTTGTNGGAGGCNTTRPADIAITGTNAFNATLPAQSVTVFVLKP